VVAAQVYILISILILILCSHAEQTSSLQEVVLEPSNDQAHADGHGEWCGNHASADAIGSYSSVICLNAPCASHGVAHVALPSQVVSHGTGVVNVQGADMAMVLIVYIYISNSDGRVRRSKNT
jgi:hypothetical protein